MSTKAIRELIQAYEDLAEAHHLGASSGQISAARAALAEVEAIERAAKVANGWGISFDGCAPGAIPGAYSEVEEAEKLFAAIANQER